MGSAHRGVGPVVEAVVGERARLSGPGQQRQDAPIIRVRQEVDQVRPDAALPEGAPLPVRPRLAAGDLEDQVRPLQRRGTVHDVDDLPIGRPGLALLIQLIADPLAQRFELLLPVRLTGSAAAPGRAAVGRRPRRRVDEKPQRIGRALGGRRILLFPVLLRSLSRLVLPHVVAQHEPRVLQLPGREELVIRHRQQRRPDVLARLAPVLEIGAAAADLDRAPGRIVLDADVVRLRAVDGRLNQARLGVNELNGALGVVPAAPLPDPGFDLSFQLECRHGGAPCPVRRPWVGAAPRSRGRS
jgi:hypothetical protein